MPVTTPEVLLARAEVVQRTPVLRALADRLRRHVQPLLDRPVYIPEQKALLSKDGGWCAEDGARLAFDPWSPHQHRCPRCGRLYRGDRHHRAWVWPYHLWLSERAVHLSLLGGVLGDSRLTGKAWEILNGYAARYRDYPNRDNVLGPTRLFFSTYLESIWLLQVVIAAWLAAGGRRSDESRVAFDTMVRDSAGLIASFDEARSNRQVWNDAAIAAGARWLGDSALLQLGLDGPHGLRWLLAHCVTPDGMWFEGENYHLFALRGLHLGAELAGDAELLARLGPMFAAPTATLLPDLTLPARGDAPFGVSVVQPRFAELWEVGWARTDAERVESLLAHLYAFDAPEREDSGGVEISEHERHRPPQRLRRELLGWKALLWMRPDAPAAPPGRWQRGSCMIPSAGVGVLRPAPGRYVSVECGGRPAGHGHPDQLHVTLFWSGLALADPGTGSYVSPQLHWYRSTLAHNAPGLAGVGQLGRAAWCAAIDARGPWAWCRAVAEEICGPGTRVVRSLVAGPDFVVDRVDIDAESHVAVDLPVHALGGLEPPVDRELIAATLDGGGRSGHEHGYDTLTNVRELKPPGGVAVMTSPNAVVVLAPRSDERVFLVDAPGPSDPWLTEGVASTGLLRRASGSGTWVQCYAPPATSIVDVRVDGGAIAVHRADGGLHVITTGNLRCVVRDGAGDEVVLEGAVPRPPVTAPMPPVRTRYVLCPRLTVEPPVGEWERHVPAEAVRHLGAPEYRRSEAAYGTAGPLEARTAVFAVGGAVYFAVTVRKEHVFFRAASAPDPMFDNEPPDIHSDGLQCYLGAPVWEGYLVVPDPASDGVRVRPVAGTAADLSRVTGTWQPSDGGYRIILRIAVSVALEPRTTFLANLVVNEMYPDRQRRAGQLALSGGGGSVYLRGDREPPDTAVLVEVV